MKVNALQQFLRSLAPALRATAPEGSAAQNLENVCDGLTPFADLDVAQFALFLNRAEEYRQRGEVAVPSAGEIEAEKVHVKLQAASDVLGQLGLAAQEEAERLQQEFALAKDMMRQAITDFLKPLGLSATFKEDAKALNALLLKNKVQQSVAELRELLNGVTDATALAEESLQQSLNTIRERLNAVELKAIATELGAAATPAAKVMENIIAKITGIAPAPKKAPRNAAAPVLDETLIREQAIKLKELLEKAIDADALSEADVDATIADLEPHNLAELQAIAKEAGIDNLGRSKTDVLHQIRMRLTETKRALESLQI